MPPSEREGDHGVVEGACESRKDLRNLPHPTVSGAPSRREPFENSAEVTDRDGKAAYTNYIVLNK